MPNNATKVSKIIISNDVACIRMKNRHNFMVKITIGALKHFTESMFGKAIPI